MYAPERVVNVKPVNKTPKCTSISRTCRGVIVTLAGGAAMVAVIPHVNYSITILLRLHFICN